MIIEACINCETPKSTASDVVAACEGGATSIELCSSLHVGGLTPSLECVESAGRVCAESVHLKVMIRPASGAYTYSPFDLNTSLSTIRDIAGTGADGIVVGAVRNRNVDVELLAPLLEAANHFDLSTTFHRAFDDVADRVRGFQTLNDMGVNQVLTACTEQDSGSCRLMNLADIYEGLPSDIVLLLCGGLTANHIASIARVLPNDRNFGVHAYSSITEEGRTRASLVRNVVSAVVKTRQRD